MSQDSKGPTDSVNSLSFKKLICDILLDLHPICTNKWMHPILTKSIHHYYLKHKTILHEYKKIKERRRIPSDRTLHIDDFRAEKYGNIIIVKWYLKNNKNDDYRNEALCWAADHGHLEIVRLLITAGTDIHVWDDYALRYSAENGHLEIIKLLIAAKANIHAWDDYALQQAVRNGHLKVVQLLVDNGANIPAWNDYTLQLAVRNGDSEIVKLLVDKGANIHS